MFASFGEVGMLNSRMVPGVLLPDEPHRRRLRLPVGSNGGQPNHELGPKTARGERSL
jgi:hypothetical protein